MRLLLAARLSKALDGQTGIESQDAQVQAWAKLNAHAIVHVAADSKSGATHPWDRPNLRPWVTEADKLAQYDGIVAYRLDRLSRGDNQSTNAIEQWAHDHGKVLLTADGLRYPCEGAEGIRWDVTKRIAHEEWLSASEWYRRMQAHLRDGGYLVGRASYGHRVAQDGPHKTLVPDEEAAEVVRQVAQDYLAGDTLYAICERLTAEGKLTTSGAKWTPRVVSRMLKNPTLVGRRKDHQGRTIMRIEPILTMATWQAVRDRLEQRATRKGIAPGNTALLTSLIFCAVCFGPMYRQTAKQGELYHCKARKGCRSVVQLHEANRLAEMWLLQRYGSNERTVTHVVPGHGYDDDIAGVKQDIRDLDVDSPEYETRHAELVRRLRDLQALPSVPATVTTVGMGETVADFWHRQDDTGKRQMLTGVLQVYYHRDWRGENGPTDLGVRFTSGGLTPREAVEKLRHAA